MTLPQDLRSDDVEVQLNPDLAKLLLPWELSSEEILKAERLKLDTLHRVIEDCIFLLLDRIEMVLMDRWLETKRLGEEI